MESIFVLFCGEVGLFFFYILALTGFVRGVEWRGEVLVIGDW